jgi:hypothetical protein
MDLNKDVYVHFTLRDRAEKIIRDGVLSVKSPYKNFGPQAVYAVSLVWGSLVPGVQFNRFFKNPKMYGKNPDVVGIIFKTSTIPDTIAHQEEVVWHRDVKLQNPKIVSFKQGVSKIRSAPCHYSEDMSVWYGSKLYNSFSEEWYDPSKVKVGFMSNIHIKVAKRYLQSRIVHPPRKIVHFLKTLGPKIKKYLEDIYKHKKGLLEGGDEEEIYDTWTDMLDSSAYDSMRYIFDAVSKALDKVDFDIIDISGSVLTAENRGLQNSFLGHLSNGLGYLIEDLTKPLSYYGDDVVSKKYSKPPDWLLMESDLVYKNRGIKILREPSIVIQKIRNLISWVESQKEKLDEQIRFMQPVLELERPRPKSEKVEILYHASVDARRILQKGFDPVVPKMKGLGGAQGDKSGNPAISFTSDLYVAKEVMRSLKEAVMIANNQVKARHILEWSKKDNILKDVKDYFRSSQGILPEEAKSPFHIMELYRIYLSFGSRYNPVYFGDMEKLMRKLKGVNSRSVGVLVCKVDMTDPDIKYVSSMHEYRVPPRAVFSVEKVIS